MCLFAASESQLGSSSILRSASRLGFATSCVHFANLDSPLPLKRPSHMGPPMVIGRACRLEVSSLATDFVNLEAPLMPQGFCGASRLLVLDSAFTETSPSVRRFAQKELISLLFGLACLDSMTSVLSYSNAGLTLSVQTLSWMDAFFSCFQCAYLDTLLLVQGSA